MRSKRIWFWSLTSVWGILASCIAVADDHSDRMMHLKNALASIEREGEIAADSGNTGAKTLLSEVHQNIAMTIADIEADEPIAETAPQIVTRNLPDLDHPLNRAKYALIQQHDRLEIPSASKAMHLRAAAFHLAAAGYESLAQKARQEAARLSQERIPSRPAGPSGPASPEIPALAPNALQRIGQAVAQLRQDMDQLRNEVNQLKKRISDFHPKAIQKQDLQPGGHRVMEKQVTKRRAEAKQRIEAAQRKIEELRRAVDAEKQQIERKAKERAAEQIKNAERKLRAVEKEIKSKLAKELQEKESK